MAGRNPSVSYAEFRRVFIRLVGTKAAATYDDLHRELGGTCSRGTIKKYRDRCLDEFRANGMNVLSESLPKELVPLVDELWALALHKGGEAWSEERAQVEGQLSELKNRLTIEAEERQELVSILDQRDRQIESLQSQVINQEGRLKDQLKLAEQLEAQIRQLGQQIERERSEYAKALSEQKSQFDHERAEWEREREHLKTEVSSALKREESEHARNQKQVDHWILQVDQERTRCAQVEEERRRDRKRFDEELLLARKREDAMSVKLGSYESKIESLESRRETLAQKLEDEQQRWLADSKVLEQERDSLRLRLVEAETRISIQEQQIHDLTDALADESPGQDSAK